MPSHCFPARAYSPFLTPKQLSPVSWVTFELAVGPAETLTELAEFGQHRLVAEVAGPVGDVQCLIATRVPSGAVPIECGLPAARAW